jgi:hypothetical protein
MPNPPTGLEEEELWNLLVDTSHAIPMYKNHKRFTEDVMIKENPDISAKELAVQLNLTLGEATVILYEIRGGKHEAKTPTPPTSPPKTTDRTLFDYSAPDG